MKSDSILCILIILPYNKLLFDFDFW